MFRNQVPQNPRPPGIIESVRTVLQALHDYVLVRCEMAGIESKAALRKLAKAAMVATAAILCLGFGFLYLTLSLIYVLAEVAGWGWGWALFISGICLLIVMTAGLFWIRAALQGQWLPVTFAELKKDSAWLSRKTTTHA